MWVGVCVHMYIYMSINNSQSNSIIYEIVLLKTVLWKLKTNCIVKHWLNWAKRHTKSQGKPTNLLPHYHHHLSHAMRSKKTLVKLTKHWNRSANNNIKHCLNTSGKYQLTNQTKHVSGETKPLIKWTLLSM